MSRIGTVRALLLLQIAIFVFAASMHFGLIFEGYRHRTAGTAESLIAIVLLAGLAVTWVSSSWARRAAIGAQVFGIIGVLVGLFTIAIGIGPRTGIDLAFHAAMLTTLIVGLAITVRASSKPPDEI
jgi:heme A synthase